MKSNLNQRKDAKTQRREGARHLCRFDSRFESGRDILDRLAWRSLKRTEVRAPHATLRLCLFATLR
jgi:hypothetical protein